MKTRRAVRQHNALQSLPAYYKGYLLTPHHVAVQDSQTGARLWSVGVFIRTTDQAEEQNRYFRLKGVFVNSKFEAFNHALSFGKRLVNEDLHAYIKRHCPADLSRNQPY